MKLYTKILLASAAIISFGFAVPVSAETITEKTSVVQQDVPNVEKTNFSAFDLNHDNILSMQEIGEKLFYIFDTDGNEVLDNNEFKKNRVLTIIPMEKETYTYVDLNDDGTPDAVKYDHDTFLKQSKLARFDKNMNGLSPQEFIGKSFLQTDTDKSKAVELKEWKEQYIASVRPKVAQNERYQQ